MPVSSAPHDRASGSRDAPALAGAAPTGATDAVRLRLYVAGVGPNSVRARTNLEALMERCAIPADALDVVDCLQEPRRALTDGVLVTPTLVRVAPGPRQVVVGNLTDTPRVLSALELEACAEEVASHAL
jgi:circadian clock protein KaiB